MKKFNEEKMRCVWVGGWMFVFPLIDQMIMFARTEEEENLKNERWKSRAGE